MALLMPSINAHDRLIRAMVRIQREHAFFSYILMNFKVTAEADPFIPTAGVSKAGDFMYNEGFIKSLDNAELIGLLVHEVMHVAKGDFFRQGNREHDIWGIASDCIINYILKQEGFTLPKNGYLPDHSGHLTIAGKDYCVAGKNTEQFYDELFKNLPKIRLMINGGGGKGKGDNGDQEGSGFGDGQGENDSPEGNCGCNGYDPKKNKSHGGFDVHIQCGESSSQSAQSESKWKKVVIEAATSARARGTMPGCMESTVDKLLNPIIDWRTRVMKFITNEIPVDYTNRLPSRAFYATGVWSPRVLRENLEVFISVDYSGSTMGDRPFFLTETAAILNSYEQVKGRLLFWDAALHEENDFAITRENRNSLLDLKVKGCNGGTTMSCYADYCEQKGYKCRLHIILTDGEIEYEPRVPQGNIIFVLTKNGRDDIVKKYGAVCRVSDIEE